MGKADAPATPDYKNLSIATSNLGKFTESGPGGSVQWSLRPGADINNPQPGDYIRNTQLSGNQQDLFTQGEQNQLAAGGLASSELRDLQGGSAGMEDALYRRGTRFYDQNFGDQEAQLRTRLENSGLAAGSEMYDKQMRNFGQTRDSAYADAADRAITGADQSQNAAVSRLAQILQMSRGQTPTSANAGAGGPDLSGAASQTYQSQLGGVNAQNAQSGQLMSLIGSLGAAAMLSDRRLKSNISEVRVEPSTGLKVYDYTILGERQRGYMAQEVHEKFPGAVSERPDGFLQVHYDLIGGVPQ
jgi:hypothetical protein